MQLVNSEYDPLTGITEETWFEEGLNGDSDRITLRRLQDVDYLLARNKMMFNEHTSKKANFNDSDGLHQIATIPLILIEKWMREGWNWYTSTDKERRAKLNDREFQKLRVRPGKL